MRPLLVLLLVAPLAAAQPVFESAGRDHEADVRTLHGEPVDAPSADILALSSEIVDGRVVQRVRVAERPAPPADSVLVRTWFRHSENGTFHTIDMEVRGEAARVEDRFRPLLRDGDFYDARMIPDARWGLENATWRFDFDAALLADATCSAIAAFTEHNPRRAMQGFDQAYLAADPPCRTARQPAPPPPPALAARVAPPPEPAPGSTAPAPVPAAPALLALALALVVRRALR